MAHKLNFLNGEASFASTQKAWHGLGQIVDAAMTAEQALKLSNQDFEVIKIPSYVNFNDESIATNYFATLRTDTKQILGNVGERYEILQNKDAFNFFDSLVDRDEAIYETAGVLGDGQITWIAAKLPHNFEVGKGDEVELYTMLWNSHDGSSAAEAIITPVRVVCNNTLNIARQKYVSKIRIKHTSNMDLRIKDAANLLGIVDKAKTALEAELKALTKIKVSDKQVQDFLIKHFATDQEFKALVVENRIDEDILSTRKSNIINTAYLDYMEGVGQNKIIGTAYGAYQGLTHYYSHTKAFHNEDNRMLNLVQKDSCSVLSEVQNYFLN